HLLVTGPVHRWSMPSANRVVSRLKCRVTAAWLFPVDGGQITTLAISLTEGMYPGPALSTSPQEQRRCSSLLAVKSYRVCAFVGEDLESTEVIKVLYLEIMTAIDQAGTHAARRMACKVKKACHTSLPFTNRPINKASLKAVFLFAAPDSAQ
ncbi:Uncharacterized protein DAT39_001803, partial [Clarias magur]